jgi:hypothetical protein
MSDTAWHSGNAQREEHSGNAQRDEKTASFTPQSFAVS